MTRIGLLVAALLAGGALAQHAGHGGVAASANVLVAQAGQTQNTPGRTTVAPARVQASFVQNLPRTKTVVLTVRAGDPSVNDGFNFNSATDGEKRFVVPLGWKVFVRFVNAGNVPHSMIVVPRPEGGSPGDMYTVADAAFPGAAHRIVVTGGGAFTGTMSFTASRSGQFLIVCGRMNHARNGQYIGLEVSGNVKEAEWR